jgi:glutamine synthetase
VLFRSCHDDLFALSPTEWRARGIGLLPQSLGQALDALEADETVSGALGPTLAREFLQLKRQEWTAFQRHVSAWELDRYADAF